jgi:probable phosphoglycerate mutase
MLLVCVRHLETEWNVRGLLQGRRDIGLAEPDGEALRAVRRNLARLQGYGSFERVLVSRLERTRRTAEIYGYRGAAVEPLLDELDFGDYEGLPRERLVRELGDRWTLDPRGLVLGESLSGLEARIRAFLGRYSALASVLAFSHGSWMRALRSIMELGDLRGMNRGWIENNEILEFDVDGRFAETPPPGGEPQSSGISK